MVVHAPGDQSLHFVHHCLAGKKKDIAWRSCPSKRPLSNPQPLYYRTNPRTFQKFDTFSFGEISFDIEISAKLISFFIKDIQAAIFSALSSRNTNCFLFASARILTVNHVKVPETMCGTFDTTRYQIKLRTALNVHRATM